MSLCPVVFCLFCIVEAIIILIHHFTQISVFGCVTAKDKIITIYESCQYIHILYLYSRHRNKKEKICTRRITNHQPTGGLGKLVPSYSQKDIRHEMKIVSVNVYRVSDNDLKNSAIFLTLFLSKLRANETQNPTRQQNFLKRRRRLYDQRWRLYNHRRRFYNHRR